MSSRGFSLVEMLVVLAVAALLAVLVLPSLLGTLRGVNLKSAGDLVEGQLDQARQTASTRNLPVDVRIYRDTAGLPYHIIALVITAAASGTANDEFLSPGLDLPGDVIFDSSSTYSSLLNTSATGSPIPVAGGPEPASAPARLQGKSYVAFTFLSNGTLNLYNPSVATLASWCLTLRDLNGAKGTGSTPAANFITLALDPTTSRISVYQP